MKKIMAIILLILIVLMFVFYLFESNNQKQDSLDDKSLISSYERMKIEEAHSRKIKFVFIFLWGIFLMIMPTEWMTFGERWKYRGSIEASDASIILTRIFGFGMMMISLFYFLFTWAL